MRIAVIGAGMIGGAVAKALAEKGHEVIATRRNVEKAKWLEEYGVRVVRNNPEAADWADVVFLAVKPNKVAKVLGKIREALNGKHPSEWEDLFWHPKRKPSWGSEEDNQELDVLGGMGYLCRIHTILPCGTPSSLAIGLHFALRR